MEYKTVGYTQDGEEWYWGEPDKDLFDVGVTVKMALSHSEVKKVVVWKEENE